MAEVVRFQPFWGIINYANPSKRSVYYKGAENEESRQTMEGMNDNFRFLLKFAHCITPFSSFSSPLSGFHVDQILFQLVIHANIHIYLPCILMRYRFRFHINQH